MANFSNIIFFFFQHNMTLLGFFANVAARNIKWNITEYVIKISDDEEKLGEITQDCKTSDVEYLKWKNNVIKWMTIFWFHFGFFFEIKERERLVCSIIG